MTLFLPLEVLSKINVHEQDSISNEILQDLNSCAKGIENEYFRVLRFELNDEDDSKYQKSTSISQRPQVDPGILKIWHPDLVRLFVSHRDTDKHIARALGDALLGYGISAFVAHDTIEPMSTWQTEILRGLESMEIMLAFITDDFHNSIWTNQEVGFALGRNTLIIPLKLGQQDPGGFLGSLQALRGNSKDPVALALEIYRLIAGKLDNRQRYKMQLFLHSCVLQTTIRPKSASRE